MIKHVTLSALALVAGFGLALGLYDHAEAQAHSDASAELAADAGADPAPAAVPAPESDPGWFVDGVRDLWKKGQIPAALILALFAGLAVARKRIGWFQQGRQAVIAAAVLGTLAMLVGDIAVRGSTPNLSMWFSALLAGITLYVKGEATPKEPA